MVSQYAKYLAMNLAEYLKANGISQVSFSKTIGVHEVTMSRILKRGSARADVCMRIEKATGGEVTLSDLVSNNEVV
jgi:DNA-binding transcriptional regulator YdaS (Cro superfamily)